MVTGTENKLQSLIQMYREGYRNPNIDPSIDKLVAMEIAHFEKEGERLKTRLISFEQKYGMESAVFYEKFQSGSLGDDMAFVEWSIFFDLYQSTQRRLDALTRSVV